MPASPGESPVFWFAGGGTGGHVYPGLSVAAAIRKRLPEARCVFFGTTRPFDQRVVPVHGHELVQQPILPWPGRRLAAWPGFLLAWAASSTLVRRRLATDQPRAVLGLGGYAAAPAMRWAHRQGVPVVMHNPDARPGKANRVLARYAQAICCQFPDSTAAFRGREVLVTGCPVRDEVAHATRAEGTQAFNLDPGKRTLVVTGASQGAKNLNDALVRLAPALAPLADAWQVVVVAGPGNDVGLRAQLSATPGLGALRVDVIDFTEQLPLLLAAADLVLSRAGASTCAELTALGRASVLVPYPYDAEVHQRHNAQALQAVGAAVESPDQRDAQANANLLREPLLRLMQDHDARERMAQAAKSLARPDAAEVIAGRLLQASGLG